MMEDDHQINHFDDGPFIFRLNDNGTGPSLLIQVCLERGWRGYQPEAADKWNLWWRNGLPAPSRRILQAWQFINHIPNGASICRKDSLARHLKCMKKVYGSIYDFSPPGYNLPLEYAKLAAECSKNRNSLLSREDDGDDTNDPSQRGQKIWICKPVGQSQGRGIYLFRRLSDLSCDSNAVVQRYIERPLLIGGYKFDLRLYVCVPSYHPLTVYLYREGLARFSTDKFSLTDLQNPFRHLTNSSLNRFGPKFAECNDRIGSGCKWTLRQVRRHLSSACGGARDWHVWQRVAALVALTALAQAAGVPPAPNCFEFFGFDVLVDADLRPWLLEVNLSPALANNCDADEIVKKPMLHDLFDLLGFPMSNTGLSLFTVWNNDSSKSDHCENGSTSRSYYEEDSGDSRQSDGNELDKWRTQHELGNRDHNQSNAKNKRRRPISRHSTRSSSSRPSAKPKRGQPVPSITIAFPSKDVTESGNANLEEDVWGRYSVPKKDDQRRKKYTQSEVSVQWGNGRDWSTAPDVIGGWVKLFPLQIMSADGIRDAVANVARYTKAARIVERRLPDADDAQLNEELRKELDSDIQIWLPEK